nr:unknown [Medicago truncatula]
MVFLCALIIIFVMEIEPSKDGKQYDVKEEFETQARIDAWRPWGYGRLPFIPYGQKKGGNGSGGLGSRGNGGEGVTQGGGEENEGKES